MPGMGGLGFLKRISDAGGKPRFPVLVLTARAMLADFFKEVEVDGFIAKPCDEAELISIIRIILDKRKSAMMLSQRIKPQILLGEDERVIAEDLVRHFGKAGYDIEVAGSGPELLEKAARRRPSLVLTKEVLPRLNGSAVASLLDVMPSMSAVPVVLYDWTRSAAEMERMQSAKIRCIRQYLHTNDAEQLVATVNTVLAR
jgi:CheY-like chemotaxis protein